MNVHANKGLTGGKSYQLGVGPLPKPHKPRVRLSKPSKQSLGEVNTTGLTPEALAYALPGGLAKLAYRNWQYARFIKFIEDKVLQMVDGKSIKILFSAPPRSGKTMFISRVVPAFYLGRNPDKRVLLITYNTEYSRTQSKAARNIMKVYGKKVFGVEVADDTATASHWDIEGHRGGMESVGAGGAITGKGADLLIIDDLVKGRLEALNITLLEEMWEWFKTDVYTRLEPGASVLIIATRWSLYDIIGQIQNYTVEDEEDENPFDDWETINFPALALKDDILGREEGEALFPERFSAERLRKVRAVQDDYWWGALYQGNPVPMKGEIIDIGWLRNQYEGTPKRTSFEYIVISADTAIKDTEIADYSVFQVWGVKEEQYYLLDLMREKMQYPALLELARGLGNPKGHWRPEFFLIEDKGSGSSLIQDLNKDGNINVFPVDPGSESKILRMQGETPALREGKVCLPKTASWLDDYLLEMRSFPRGKRDQVDATSQFLKFMRMQAHGIDMW